MKRTYRVLAYVVAAGVVVQAVSVVWAVSGLFHWIDTGGVADKALLESKGTAFPEALGFAIHNINGGFVVPAAALALVIVSFFVRARGAIRWAVIVFALTVVQGQLGFLGQDIPAVGALHGLNALALFTAALVAARRRLTPKEQPETDAVEVEKPSVV